jgi:hypothetical protein
MKGYHTLKQFVEDYSLFLAAKKIDHGRDSGETITNFMRKKINDKLNNATKHFRKFMARNNYNKDDLRLIATHDTLRTIRSLEQFIKECFEVRHASHPSYKKVLSSNAFKSGRLNQLYVFIPKSIETKTDFYRFIRMRRNVPKGELNVIMGQICKKNWREWLYELISKEKIQDHRGRWIT